MQVNWRQIFNNSLSVYNWIKWIIDYCGKSLYKLFLAWFHFEPQMTWTWSGIRYTTHQSKANAIKLTFSLKSGTQMELYYSILFVDMRNVSIHFLKKTSRIKHGHDSHYFDGLVGWLLVCCWWYTPTQIYIYVQKHCWTWKCPKWW